MHAERALSRAASQFCTYAEAAVSFESGMGPKPSLRSIGPATFLPHRAETDAVLSKTAAGHNGCLSTVYKLPRPLRTSAAQAPLRQKLFDLEGIEYHGGEGRKDRMHESTCQSAFQRHRPIPCRLWYAHLLLSDHNRCHQSSATDSMAAGWEVWGLRMMFETLGTVLGMRGHLVLVFLIDGCKCNTQQSLLQCRLHALQGS